MEGGGERNVSLSGEAEAKNTNGWSSISISIHSIYLSTMQEHLFSIDIFIISTCLYYSILLNSRQMIYRR